MTVLFWTSFVRVANLIGYIKTGVLELERTIYWMVLMVS